MGEVDKPFSCPQPGCGMSFTNEDHLTVHRRRHEMMHLTVPGDHHTSSLVKHSGFIIDQTPTPTRFLRQCEEVGLFQDLNPFDEQFRRASLSRSTHSINEEVGTGGSLDTPRILPLADSDETISSTSRDDLNLAGAPAASNISNSSHYYTTSHRHTTRPQTSIRISSPVCEEDVETREGLRLNVSSAADAAANTTSVISTPTPVITAGPSVTHSLDVQLSGDRLAGSYQIPLHPSQSNIASPGSNVPPSPSTATVLQLLLRLPNGQSIPVEIPATPVASKNNNVNHGGGITSFSSQTPIATTAIASHPIPATGKPVSMLASGDHQVPQQPSLAKMKLKAALASSNTAARPGASRNSRANTADRIAEMTMSKARDINAMLSSDEEDYEESCDSLSASSQSTVTMAGVIGPDGQRIERRRRHSSADDDPAEKRRKFLERNRAAAIRCREKKKKWIETLAGKSDELGYVNQKLQTEVSTLRAEVAALKSMLLQHKDCPVTMAMHGGEYKDEADSVAHLQSVMNPAIIQANNYSHSSSIMGMGQKTRVRSLSMPSIPSSASSPVAPLTLNPIMHQNANNTHYAIPIVSSSSTVSSTTKVVSISSNITPMNLSNSMSSMHQPILHTATVTHAAPVSIMKMSPARIASPKSSSAQHMVIASPPGVTQVGEVTIFGSGELMSSDGHQSRVIQDGSLASNIIVSTRSPSIQHVSHQQHYNRILPAHSPASVTTQAANVLLAAHSPNNIHMSASKDTHVPQLLNLSINNKHSSAMLRKKH